MTSQERLARVLLLELNKFNRAAKEDMRTDMVLIDGVFDLNDVALGLMSYGVEGPKIDPTAVKGDEGDKP